MTIDDYLYLPQELRPPMLVRQTGVHHYTIDIEEYDEECSNENENEEMFENIYRNKVEFYEENPEIPTPYIFKCDYYEDDEEEYAYEEDEEDDDADDDYDAEYAYEETDDIEYSL